MCPGSLELWQSYVVISEPLFPLAERRTQREHPRSSAESTIYHRLFAGPIVQKPNGALDWRATAYYVNRQGKRYEKPGHCQIVERSLEEEPPIHNVRYYCLGKLQEAKDVHRLGERNPELSNWGTKPMC